MVSRHHSNSRRFTCSCGRKHQWPTVYQSPVGASERITCPCGKVHTRDKDSKNVWRHGQIIEERHGRR